MKTLLILRHAKAASDLPVPDHDRPLTDRGERQAAGVGQWLSDEGLTPDLVISSTALRAVRTAELAAAACDYTGQIDLHGDLYMAEADRLITAIQHLPNDRHLVLLVAHNPGLERLLSKLTRHDEHLSPGSVAHIELRVETWAHTAFDARARLRTLRHAPE